MRRGYEWLLMACAAAALLLLVHNHALSLLPDRRVDLSAGSLQRVLPAEVPVATAILPSWPEDRPNNLRSRLRLWEDGRELILKLYRLEPVLDLGHGRWVHRDGRVIFTGSDNTDPRTNGRSYAVTHPVAYGVAWSRVALLVFVAACAGLRWLRTSAQDESVPPTPAGKKSIGRGTLILPLLVFTAGLYCNTGTLAPYAVTHVPELDPSTGQLIHIDQPVTRELFAFAEGGERGTWEHSIYLRRVLYLVPIWPFARGFGFEIGAVLAHLFWNVLAAWAWMEWIRRRWGESSASAAAWLTALYPGAAYWVGLPILQGMIFPSVLVLTILLHEIGPATPRRLALLSLGMGAVYLIYDFAVFYFPASLLLLSRRPIRLGALSLGLQILPTLLWTAWMGFYLAVPLVNANSGVYTEVLQAYLNPGDWSQWARVFMTFPEVLGDVFFGAGFLFLPALFLTCFILRSRTGTPFLNHAEGALLAGIAAVFLFNNLAPEYQATWPMRGNWIARIYEPLFVILIGSVARWWGSEPDLRRRQAGLALITLTCALNALVVFGPILGNPRQVSERAFYAFYNHSENHLIYRINLHRFGAHPLGFHPAVPRPDTPAAP